MDQLPEQLQRYIVSTLPIEDAVRISALSSKWRKIWYSLPCLIFDFLDFPNMEAKVVRFEEFINKTVAHHDASTIDELVLCLSSPIGPFPCISTEWVSFALDHMVQYLTLDGMMKQQQRLPNSLFTSKSLVTLDLSLIDYALTWPTTIFLPNLAELNLRGLIFEEETLCLELTSTCPSLERLKIVSCNLSHVKLFSISAPVVYLAIIKCVEIFKCELRLRTPFLEEFEYDNQLARKYDFASISPNFYAIIKFHQAVAPDMTGDDIGRCAMEFYGELLNVSHLMVNHWFMEVTFFFPSLVRYCMTVFTLMSQVYSIVLLLMAQFLYQRRDVLLKFRPTPFNNLVYMKVTILSMMQHFELLLFIISRCPNLQFLKIIISVSSRYL